MKNDAKKLSVRVISNGKVKLYCCCCFFFKWNWLDVHICSTLHVTLRPFSGFYRNSKRRISKRSPSHVKRRKNTLHSHHLSQNQRWYIGLRLNCRDGGKKKQWKTRTMSTDTMNGYFVNQISAVTRCTFAHENMHTSKNELLGDDRKSRWHYHREELNLTIPLHRFLVLNEYVFNKYRLHFCICKWKRSFDHLHWLLILIILFIT